MLNFNEGAVKVLASDFSAMLGDIDRSLASSFKTSALIPEVFDGSGMPAAQSQRVFRRMSDAVAKMVDGRAEIVSAIAHLQVLQGRSNCRETATGCPLPWEPLFAEKQKDFVVESAPVEA